MQRRRNSLLVISCSRNSGALEVKRISAGLKLRGFDGWHTGCAGEQESQSSIIVVMTCKDLKSSRKTVVAHSAHSSFSIMSEYSSPLCSGLVEGKVLTVLTFFCDLGSVCTYRPDFIPSFDLFFVAECLVVLVQRTQCQARMAGPKQE